MPRSVTLPQPLTSLVSELDGNLGGFIEGGGCREVGGFEYFAAFLGVCAREAHHHRHVRLHLRQHLDDAVSYHVAPRDAAKDVEHDRLDVGVAQDDAEGGLYFVLTCAASNV